MHPLQSAGTKHLQQLQQYIAASMSLCLDCINRKATAVNFLKDEWTAMMSTIVTSAFLQNKFSD